MKLEDLIIQGKQSKFSKPNRGVNKMRNWKVSLKEYLAGYYTNFLK